MGENHVTVRVPALPEQIGIQPNDRILLWVSADNKTRQITTSQLRTWTIEGFSGSRPPVVDMDGYIVTVGEAEAGGQVFPIPSLEGKTFILRRQGQGRMAPEKYEILDAGGFKLVTPGDVLVFGETFEIEVKEFNVTPAAGGGIVGVRPISSSTALTAGDINKLIQIRSGATPITITLPDLTTVPENSEWPFEMMINNSYKCKIITASAQNIYFRTTTQAVYIGPGESLKFFAGSDGWYVTSSSGNWSCVGNITPSLGGGLNEILLDGSLYFRDREPRLWDFAQTLGASLVNDSVWITTSVTMSNPTRTVLYPYRGCFSRGDGSTTFRVPDLRGVSLRGIKRGGGYVGLASSTDAERYINIAGSFQDHMFQGHAHNMFVDNANTYTGSLLTTNNSPARRQGSGAGLGNSNYEYNITSETGAPTLGATSIIGGAETRMENIGINWYIKT